ncbi:MAG: nucleotide sugar dehydrogenase [Aestuariivirga sp.]
MHLLRKVCVIGLGYVGLPTAAVIASAGHEVIGVDTNDHIFKRLSSGSSTIEEEGVKELVEQELTSGKLIVAKAPAQADVFIICVPTPITPFKTVDIGLVAAATRSILPYVKRGDMVILESTSPIATTRKTIGGILAEAGFDITNDLDLCYCPERVYPGNTLKEIVHNDRVVGGLTPRAARRARDFYKSFCKGNVAETSAEAAEFSKLAENTYRDVNIALANSFARIAELAGIDVGDVINTANQHPRVNILQPGAGVGGHCIPVDPWFLVESYPAVSGLVRHAREINDSQPVRLLDRAELEGLTRGATIAVLGLAYRADIDDPRESPAELLIAEALDRGYSLKVHDPFVDERHLHLEKYGFTRRISDAVRGVDAVFLMTGHTAYKSMDPEDLLSGGAGIVVDGCRVLAGDALTGTDAVIIRCGAPSRRGKITFKRRIAGELA